MKFSGGAIILILLALALIAAMVITLTIGGNYSRHGYGSLPSSVDVIVRVDESSFYSPVTGIGVLTNNFREEIAPC